MRDEIAHKIKEIQENPMLLKELDEDMAKIKDRQR